MPNPFILIGVLIAMFLLGVTTWLTLGWLADKYDAYRTDNWTGPQRTAFWTAVGAKSRIENFLAGVAEQSGAGAPETSVRCGAPVALCLGCPPVGHPTDKTRCDPCPRKGCDHDWQIWPETDGKIQHCLKCKANRETQLDPEECGNHSAGSPP